MTALAADNANIVAKDSNLLLRQDFPAEANAVFFQGAIVVINADGFAEPGTTATTLFALGRCRVPADNTGGGNGDITVTVDSGIFGPYVNEATSIAQTDVGQLCHITDDQTVNLSATGRSVAGTIFEVTADGVFVAFPYPAAPAGT